MMLRKLAVVFLLAATLATAAQSPEPLRTPGDRPIDIEHIRLELQVDLPKKTVRSKAILRFATLRELSGFALDAVDFDLEDVQLKRGDERIAIARLYDGKQLHIELPQQWPRGQSAELVVTYRVREPKDGLFFFGPTPAAPNVPWTVWSQGEPVSNRHWIPCLDHPDERQTSELVVNVADGFEVLSNGRLVEKKSNPDKTVTFHWKQEKPHVSYLITLVVGPFAIVREDWRGKEVSYYVPLDRKGDVSRSFGRTKAMLDLFSRKFGVDYPWEKYAQVVVEQFSWGGMENTSATTLHDYALHDKRAALDSDPDGLISHELGHQWWGDLITCRDWAHLWLNEGWASYCEIIWAEHHLGRDEADYDLIGKARGALSGAKERPVVDRRYPNANSMFDARSYPKGAWILHMIRRRLGEDLFWRCVQRFAREHQYQSVETADLRRTFERVSQQSLERFFHQWTERAGNPTLEIRMEYLSDSKLLKVAVKQTQPGEAFHLEIPVRWRLHGESNAEWQSDELRLTEKEQTILVRTGAAPVDFVVDPELSVLADLKIEQSRDWWVRQLNSPHVAVRVRAAEAFGRSKSPQDREALAAALKKEKFWGVAREIAAALGESGGEFCRDALIDGLNRPEPKIRRACAEQLGKFVGDAKAAAALKEMLRKGDASYFVEAAALSSYGRLRQSDSVAVMLPWLGRDSHQEVLRSAAVEGLGNSRDISAMDGLIAWTQRNKPRTVRSRALAALAQLARTANPDEGQRRQMAAAIGACLEGEATQVRRAAIEAIRELGRSAAPSADVLDMISRHDTDPGVADLARKAAERVRSETPAPVELTRLREELDKLKRENDELKKRLDKVERK